jgi:hypothetical protein
MFNGREPINGGILKPASGSASARLMESDTGLVFTGQPWRLDSGIVGARHEVP